MAASDPDSCPTHTWMEPVESWAAEQGAKGAIAPTPNNFAIHSILSQKLKKRVDTV